MGQDKALLDWRGRPLLAHMVTAAREARADRVVISGPEDKYGAFGECIPDRGPGQGPLGGIASVLHSLPGQRVLAVACDMPLLPPEFLWWLWERAEAGCWTVPLTAPQRLEPLCAVYDPALLPLMDAALAGSDYKIARALAGARQRRLSPEMLAAAGFGAGIFYNCNMPADLGGN